MTNREQFKVLIKAIRTIYGDRAIPDAYSFELWYSLLKDIDYETLTLAVHKYLNTQHYAPTVADIRRLATEIKTVPTADWSEAWQNVMVSIRRYGYMQEERALESMEEPTRSIVKRLGWQTLCMMEADAVPSVRANFRNIYTQMQERERADAVLPGHLIEKINTLRLKQTEMAAISERPVELIGEKHELHDADMDRVHEMIEKLKKG